MFVVVVVVVFFCCCCCCHSSLVNAPLGEFTLDMLERGAERPTPGSSDVERLLAHLDAYLRVRKFFCWLIVFLYVVSCMLLLFFLKK